MRNPKGVPGSFIALAGRALLKPAHVFRKSLIVTLACALGLTLSTPSLAQAEDLQMSSQADEQSVSPAPVSTPEVETDTQLGDGLEIGPEIIGQPVGAAIPAPTVNQVFYDDTTISGANVQRKRVGGKVVRSTVYVTLKGKDGNEKATVSVTPKSGTAWTVSLPNGVKVAPGDTVTVYQTLENDTSSEVTINAEPSKAFLNKDKIKMPVGEIWIEQAGAANIVNAEEQAEALRLVQEANPDIAGDIKSVELKISGTSQPKTGTINVTYTDGTKSGEIEAPGLEIKQVTETSIGANVSDITVVDNEIKGQLNGTGPFKDIKVQIVLKISPNGLAKFNSENGCTVDKNSSDPVEVSVDSKTGEFTYAIPGNAGLPRAQVVGVLVKEKNKFVSCGTSNVILAVPQKTEVRDPKKLTDDDKKAIDKAIRDANTINGVSKLPDGTGFINDPAFIEFDKDGNVTIISPNDVETDWDNDGNPIYAKNADGTYKVNDGAKVTKIPAKDLVKNIAPKSPAIAVDTDKGEVTITPPAYENPGDDTDLMSYTITYKDALGAEKTITATRTVDDASGKTTWTADNATVDANTGVITLKVEDIEVGGTVTATAKDNGGLEGDTDKLDSVVANKTLETATVSYDRNGGTGEMAGKTVNKGAEYEILASAFTAPENEKFKTWQIGTTELKAGEKIRVKEDTTIKAIWQDYEVKVSYNANGGSGDMTGKTLKKGSKYTVLPNGFTAPDDTQEFKAWEVDGQEVAPGTEITVNGDTVVKAVWKKIPVDNPNSGSNNNGDGATKASKSRNSGKLPKTGYAGMPYQVAAMILVAGGLLIAGSKKTRKH